MKKKRSFWYLLMIGAAMLWTSAIFMGFFFFSEWGYWSWLFFAVLIVIHVAELKPGLAVGKQFNLPKSLTIAKTMLFGSPWWLPVKRGIFER